MNTARQTLIQNEQTKLLANALDRASTAVGVGSIWPLINISRPSAAPINLGIFVQFLAGVCFFLFFAIVLHLQAKRVLRGLR